MRKYVDRIIDCSIILTLSIFVAIGMFSVLEWLIDHEYIAWNIF